MNQERLNMITDMLEKNPNDPFLQYAVALEFKKSGKKREAIDLLKKLIADQPEYLASYYQLGKLLEDTGDSEGAMLCYRTGKIIAEKANDQKTLGELTEALFFLTDEE